MDLQFNFVIEFQGGRFDASNNTWADVFTEKVLKNYKEIPYDKLEQVAKCIQQFETENLMKGQTYFGSAVAPLAPLTIARKGHDRPFFETGLLFRSVLYREIKTGSWEIYVGGDRASIAYRLQIGDASANLPARPFFGISDYLLKKIDQILGEEKK